MCTACGEFVLARQEGDSIALTSEECPACGGRRFKHNGTGEYLRTD